MCICRSTTPDRLDSVSRSVELTEELMSRYGSPETDLSFVHSPAAQRCYPCSRLLPHPGPPPPVSIGAVRSEWTIPRVRMIDRNSVLGDHLRGIAPGRRIRCCRTDSWRRPLTAVALSVPSSLLIGPVDSHSGIDRRRVRSNRYPVTTDPDRVGPDRMASRSNCQPITRRGTIDTLADGAALEAFHR